MESKNYMFQYATRHKVLADTSLITESEADNLFYKNVEDFKKRLLNDENPEMAIWIDCKDESNYGKTKKHWCSDDIKIIDDEIYIRA